MLFQVLSEAILGRQDKKSLYNLIATEKVMILFKSFICPTSVDTFQCSFPKNLIILIFYFFFRTTPTAAKVFALLVPFFHKIFPSFQIVYP